MGDKVVSSSLGERRKKNEKMGEEVMRRGRYCEKKNENMGEKRQSRHLERGGCKKKL